MTKPPPNCLNCEASLTGRFCHDCGQDHRYPRLDGKAMLRDGFEAVFDVESSFWRTFTALLRSPGQRARDYVDGKRRRYAPPLRYLLVAFAFFALFLLITGSSLSEFSQEFARNDMTVLQNSEFQKYLDWLDRNFSFISFTIVPVVGTVNWFLFRKRGLNLMECMVPALYCQAQSTMIISPLQMIGVRALGINPLFGMLVAIAYNAWATTQFFQTSWWRGLLAYTAGFLVWMIVYVTTLLCFLFLYLFWP